jgi:Family of unknown function (DUF5427)
MAQKKTLTDDELLAQFEGIGSKGTPSTASIKPTSKPSRPAPAAAALQDDPLAELENLAKAKPPSRPNTPRTPSALNRNRDRSPMRRSVDAATPTSTGSARTSEDKNRPAAPPRKSHESTRSFHQGLTPTSEESAEETPKPAPVESPKQSSGGGWWGGIFATASAAVKQAEAAVKDLQKNEDAQKWVEQVKGNVGNLNKLGKRHHGTRPPAAHPML